MTEATTKEQETKTEGAAKASVKESAPREKRAFKKNPRKAPRRKKVVREFDHRVADIRRVTRVVAGGRRFSFSVTLIAGNRKGSVGVGIGKAGDTAVAIDKALADAKRHMIVVPRTKEGSIPHEVEAKYTSAVVKIFPTPGKSGLTAGSAVRHVLELAGVKGVGAKILSRSKNKINNARATLKALEKLQAQDMTPTLKKKETAVTK